jgi:hypothetical protein
LVVRGEEDLAGRKKEHPALIGYEAGRIRRIRDLCQVGAVKFKKVAWGIEDARRVRRIHWAGHHEHVAIRQ